MNNDEGEHEELEWLLEFAQADVLNAQKMSVGEGDEHFRPAFILEAVAENVASLDDHVPDGLCEHEVLAYVIAFWAMYYDMPISIDVSSEEDDRE